MLFLECFFVVFCVCFCFLLRSGMLLLQVQCMFSEMQVFVGIVGMRFVLLICSRLVFTNWVLNNNIHTGFKAKTYESPTL